MMHLIDVDSGQWVRVTSIRGGRHLEGKLRQLGLLPGDQARVMRHAPFGGPIMIEVNGRTIALGRGIASKIAVELEGERS
jgi:ferrous iron transport protein A